MGKFFPQYNSNQLKIGECMVNVFLWFFLIFATFVLILNSFRYFGLYGLMTFSSVALIIANIQVLEQVDILGFTASFGTIVFSSTFLISDIIGEIYGKEKAKISVYLGFAVMIFFVIISQISILFVPNKNDWAYPHLKAIFTILPRVTAASLISYLISNYYDVISYQIWKKRYPQYMWLRNNVSTFLSQALDAFVFTFLAFFGVFPLSTLIQIMVTTYVFKIIVAICDTPFLYIAVNMKKKGKKGILLTKLGLTDAKTIDS
jgi:uncharacterized integral membrane protein (TIGR00697 family)